MDAIFSNKLEKSIATITIKLQKTLIYKVFRKSILSTLPFVILGSFLKLLQILFLEKGSLLMTFFPQIDNFNWLITFDSIVNLIYGLTLGIISLMATFSSANFTASHFDRDGQMAGTTSFVCLLLLSYTFPNNRLISFNPDILGLRGLLFALIVGMAVGWIFSKTSKKLTSDSSKDLLNRYLNSFWSVTLVIVLVSLVSFFIEISLNSTNLFSNLITNSINNKSQLAELFKTLLLSFFSIIAAFLGWRGFYTQPIGMGDSTVLKNLNYAFSHHSAWGAPNIFNGDTLYYAFGSFGGVGSVLALIVAIMLFSKNKNYNKISKVSIVPSIFNIDAPMMVGLPLLFNPLFIVPMILAPICSMLVAALGLVIHLMPPSVYPIPVGTPGFLNAFIGTNGSWQALVFTILTFIISVLIYIPFVKLADKINDYTDSEVNTLE
ncbi:PTS transporter subunit EIIC [Companilactobacillus metriopterae]|uniref:PTS transporter subunit EIIC n=1 Tax=Companilactobacillus metriopterae TaxID=1909267 RepID=UPI00100B9F0D|nr:PTS transporter subunit EIIC [Companilactobacillus metriopterae]